MVTIPDSWKRPRVVKVKRKRLLQGQSKVCFPSNPRFNVRVHSGVKEPKPASEHSLVKIRRQTPHGTLKLTPPRYRRKQALMVEKKESGRQTLSMKTKQKKKQGPRLESTEEEAAKTVDVILSSSFCRLVFCFAPKYTITSDRAWETTPNQRVYDLSPSMLM